MLKFFKKSGVQNLINYFLLAAAVILVYKIASNFNGFVGGIKSIGSYIVDLLFSFIIGISIAYIVNPLVKKFDEVCISKINYEFVKKRRDTFSILPVYISVILVVILILYFLIPAVVKSLIDLFGRVPSYYKQFLDFKDFAQTDEFFSQFYNVILSIEQYFVKFVQSFDSTQITATLNNVIKGVLGATSVILNIFLGIIIGFYFLKEKNRFIKGVQSFMSVMLPEKKQKAINGFAKEANKIFSGFVVGKLIDSMIIAILCFIGVAIMGLKNALLITVLVGVTNMIPFFGPFIGGIPAVFLTLFESPVKAFWLAIFIFLLQQFDGMILGPKILGNSINLSPFWIIFAIVVFGGMFGFAGMFFGVPIMGIISLWYKRFIEKKQNKKLAVEISQDEDFNEN